MNEKSISGLPICIEDFESIAKCKLPKSIYDYYRSGADEEHTLNRNLVAYKKLLIRPRILRNVSYRDTSVKLLNGNLILKSPICIAPTASQKMAHPDGEIATARAAAKTGTLMIASTIATSSLEQIASAAPEGIRWFQLYIYKNQTITADLIRRAEINGYKALVVTVDTPMAGKRRDDLRNGLVLPSHLRMENFVQEDGNNDQKLASGAMNDTGSGGSGFASYANSLFDKTLSWSKIDWLKSITELPIILKGILTAEDALEACKHNVAGLIVSNHGARQLDSAPATIEALPEIVRAAGNQLEIFVDGGLRTGNSVFKALALGAKAVFIGRPILWGLAYDGEAGVRRILDILNEELSTTMALAGCQNLDDIRDVNNNLVVAENFYYSKI